MFKVTLWAIRHFQPCSDSQIKLSYKQLPHKPGQYTVAMDCGLPPQQDPPNGAEWVWGKDDNVWSWIMVSRVSADRQDKLGRLDFLTASRVAKAA